MNQIYLYYGVAAFAILIFFILLYFLYRKNLHISNLDEYTKELENTINNLKLQAVSQSERINSLQEFKDRYEDMLSRAKEKDETIMLSKEKISKLSAHLEEKSDLVNTLENSLAKEKETTQNLRNELNEQKSLAATLQTSLEEQKKSINEKIEILQDTKEKMTREFHSIATQILDNNSKKFVEQNREGVKEILTPLNRQIEEFKKRVDDIYDKESKERSMLFAEIKVLRELNERIGKDAINLTNALKGQAKSQGIWGEMILEKVLESSGLRKGVEYEREVTLNGEDNSRFRPDVIVNLPGDRQIIIDAKTSLVAYERYISSESEKEKENYLSLHLKSIHEHIKLLSSKDYEKLQGVNSLDFIFMFIPIEGALMLALEKDPGLYDKAFKEHIVLVSPTTLLVALRAVENSWRYEKQARNIKEVTKRAEALYGKFVGFVKDFEGIGKSIKKSQDSYDEAIKKLSTGKGNIIRQITLFKESANISPKNEIPEELKERSFLEG